MNNICKLPKIVYCKLKDKREKRTCEERDLIGETCSLIIGMEGLFHFREKYAYNHRRKYHLKSDYSNDVNDDLQKLKGEVEWLKNTIQSLIKTREEGDRLKKSVEDIKEEVKLLTLSNKNIKAIIDYLEENSD